MGIEIEVFMNKNTKTSSFEDRYVIYNLILITDEVGICI